MTPQDQLKQIPTPKERALDFCRRHEIISQEALDALETIFKSEAQISDQLAEAKEELAVAKSQIENTDVNFEQQVLLTKSAQRERDEAKAQLAVCHEALDKLIVAVRDTQQDVSQEVQLALLNAIKSKQSIGSEVLERVRDEQLGYSIALQRAIEAHCDNRNVPPHISKDCPHHAKKLNDAHEKDLQISEQLTTANTLLERAKEVLKQIEHLPHSEMISCDFCRTIAAITQHLEGK